MKILITMLATAITAAYSGCSKDPAVNEKKPYKTKNVVIIVVDGPRYTETWGHPTRQLIPHRNQMLAEGVLCTKFYNDSFCYTNSGHTAITTGVYQNINNSGLEIPRYPSIFQYWLKATQRPASEAWVITTKDKLHILSDCTLPQWQGQFRPMTDCGVSGPGSGYRQDSVTFNNAKNILTTNHPGLVLINFKQPDADAHANDSAGYVQGIIDTDRYVYELWQHLQSDPFYQGNTTLIVTNDHGRHTAGHLDGFVSHTDRCDGCRHIEFFGIGPDFKKNYVCETKYSQIDIANTVADLMGFSMPSANGRIMRDVLK
jgi:arylsulfatase A-like enzyme